MKPAEKLLGNGNDWLNFWRISVLGVLLGLSMWFNHQERKAHNEDQNQLLMKLAECTEQRQQ